MPILSSTDSSFRMRPYSYDPKVLPELQPDDINLVEDCVETVLDNLSYKDFSVQFVPYMGLFLIYLGPKPDQDMWSHLTTSLQDLMSPYLIIDDLMAFGNFAVMTVMADEDHPRP